MKLSNLSNALNVIIGSKKIKVAIKCTVDADLHSVILVVKSHVNVKVWKIKEILEGKIWDFKEVEEGIKIFQIISKICFKWIGNNRMIEDNIKNL